METITEKYGLKKTKIKNIKKLAQQKHHKINIRKKQVKTTIFRAPNNI